MAFDPVLTGATANDGTGDPLRTAFTRINDNFDLAVEGAASSTDGTVVQFDGTTGKVVKASSVAVADIIVEGDARLTDARTPTAHGNEAHTSTFVDAAGAAAAAPVQSVNTQTGAVVLAAADVGAYPDTNPSSFVDAAGAAAAAPVQSVNSATGTVVLDSDDVAEGTTNLYNRVPTGGTTGQVLAKASGTNYDAAWANTDLSFGAARLLISRAAFLSGTALVLGNNQQTGGVLAGGAVTADSAALDITGDIDLRLKLRPAIGAAWNFVNGMAVGKTGAYALGMTLSNGIVRLYWVESGVTKTADSTVAPSANLGTSPSDGWIRATLDVDNGASGRDITFFTSTDGTNWTQLGTTVTQANTTSIDNSSGDLKVGDGTPFDGSPSPRGQIFRAQVLNGIGGTVEFDADFETQTADALAFTESSTNAATVTISTTRYFYGLPNRGFVSVGLRALSANQDYFDDFVVKSPTVVDLLAFAVTTAPSSTATVHAAIYAADENYQPVGAPVAVFGPISVATSTTAFYTTQITPVTLTPGNYLLGFNSSVAVTLRNGRRATLFVGPIGATPMAANLNSDRTNAAFPSTLPGWYRRFDTSTVGQETFAFLRWRPA